MAVYNENVMKVVFHQPMLGHENINIMYFSHVVPELWTIAAMEIVLDEVQAWLSTTLAPLLSSDVGYTQLDALSMAEPPAPFVLRPLGTPISGEVLTPSVGNNSPMCVSFRTDLAGRSFRGRNYLGGVPAAELNNPNNVNDEYAGFVQAAYTTLRDDLLTEQDVIHSVYSTITNGAPRLVGVATGVTQYIANTRLDTQRRRMKGTGLE